MLCGSSCSQVADCLGQSNGLTAASHWTAPSISDRNCPRDSRLIVLGRTFPTVCFLRMLNLKSASSDQPIGSFEMRPFLLASSSDSSLKFSKFYWLCFCIHNRRPALHWQLRCTGSFASQKIFKPSSLPFPSASNPHLTNLFKPISLATNLFLPPFLLQLPLLCPPSCYNPQVFLPSTNICTTTRLPNVNQPSESPRSTV